MIHDAFSENEDSSTVYFDQFLKQLVKFFNEAFRFRNSNIIIHEKLSPIQLDINLAIPVSLIFTELMIHAKRDLIEKETSSEVSIVLSQVQEWVELKISENGSALFDKKDLKNKDTLTFTIIDALVTQINGEFDAVYNEKSVFKLSFKNRRRKGSASHMKMASLNDSD